MRKILIDNTGLTYFKKYTFLLPIPVILISITFFQSLYTQIQILTILLIKLIMRKYILALPKFTTLTIQQNCIWNRSRKQSAKLGAHFSGRYVCCLRCTSTHTKWMSCWCFPNSSTFENWVPQLYPTNSDFSALPRSPRVLQHEYRNDRCIFWSPGCKSDTFWGIG